MITDETLIKNRLEPITYKVKKNSATLFKVSECF